MFGAVQTGASTGVRSIETVTCIVAFTLHVASFSDEPEAAFTLLRSHTLSMHAVAAVGHALCVHE